MEEINSISQYINNKLSSLQKTVFFEKDYIVIDSENNIDWLNIEKLVDLSQKRVWKTEITLDNNDKKNIILKINLAHSLQNTEGEDFLLNTNRLNNIYSKLNFLRENYTYFNYTYSKIFLKSSLKLKNTKFLNWSNYLYDKYIDIDMIEYLDGYITFKEFKKTNSFNDILKVTVSIFDIIKILVENNLIMNDLGMRNILIKGDISSYDLKLIDYEKTTEKTNEEMNLKNLSSIYELENYNDVQLKDKNIINSKNIEEPLVFSYLYMKDYLYLLSSICIEYKYSEEYNTSYSIIKHCVDNKLNVTEAKNYIQTNFIDTA